MATIRGDGQRWDYTPDGAAVTAGDVVLLGTDSEIISVVVADTKDGELGAVQVAGLVDFDTSDTLVQGDAAYYNSVSDEMTDETTDTYAGRVEEMLTNIVRVDINFGQTPSGS